MGFYDDTILPRIIDTTCGSSLIDPLRERVCAGLVGDVVEVGFGSGRNVGCYPDAVRSVTAVEPSDTAWRLAADRIADSALPIERSGLDGARLPFPDNSFDAALSTFTMCTIPDLAGALGELGRVVKPGGTVHFLEHGTAPDAGVRRWQRRLEPIQKRIAGGCHLTRDIPAALTDAGFHIVEMDRFYQRGAPRAFSAVSLGVATRPA